MYCFLQVFYLKYALQNREEGENASPVRTSIFAIVVFLFWLKQVKTERLQAQVNPNYWCEVGNMVDVAGILIMLFLIFITGCHLSLLSAEVLRVLAAIATCITLTRLIDWMRLFEETAFYVLLIQVTLSDIKYFMVLLLIALLMFGIPIMMLDMNSEEDYEMIDDSWHNWLLNLLFNQYLLALGEFGMDNFGVHPQAVLVYCFFFAATFISQLTMLNMLIAIMADSFDKVFENRAINGIKMKIEFAGDYSNNMGSSRKNAVAEYMLFYGRPAEGDDDEGDDDEWEGTVRRLTRTMEKSASAVKKIVDSKCDKIQVTLDESSKKEAQQGRNLKAHIDNSIRNQSEQV